MKLQHILILMLLVIGGAAHAGTGAADQPQEIIVNDVEFMRIPGGWFWYPVHDRDPKTGHVRKGLKQVKTWVDTYYLAKYEARASHFMRFMNSGESRHMEQYAPRTSQGTGSDGANAGCSVRKNHNTGAFYLVNEQANLPATHLSWELANELAVWMGFRLPTDAEWVHAFRGDDHRIFPWGDEFPDDTYAAFQAGATQCNPHPVTSYSKGRSPYGIYNMSGNVFEYVADWDNIVYTGQLQDGVRNPVATEPYLTPDMDKPKRLLRGGRWASGPREMAINGNSDNQPADEPFICFGTRFALDADAVSTLLAQGKAKAVH